MTVQNEKASSQSNQTTDIERLKAEGRLKPFPEELKAKHEARLESTVETPESVQQIVIELTQGGWTWDAFGGERRLFGGTAQSLTGCVIAMCRFLRDDWKLPLQVQNDE